VSDWLKKVRLDSQEPVKPEPPEPEKLEVVVMANLTIKVPRKDRDFWVGAARQEGTNLTRVVTEYLESRFGRG
jgi:hypothetical protein